MFKNYLLNTSLHGLHFIADKRFHTSERVFWTICVIVSWSASIFLMYSSYQQFLNNAVSFTVDTTYLDWTVTFPSIVFCENGNTNSHRFADEWFGESRDYDIDAILENIAFFKGTVSYQVNKCLSKKSLDACPRGNFRLFTNTIRNNCSQLFQDCYWNDEQFDCCKRIFPMETVIGVCYAINSLVSNNTHYTDLLTISRKIKAGLGKLNIGITNRNILIFALGQEAIPTYNSGVNKIFDPLAESSFSDLRHINIFLSIREMVNEKEVKSVGIERRGCRFPDENYLKGSPRYSYSLCITECIIARQKKHCNCTLHLMPGTEKLEEKDICTLEGMVCISKIYEHVLSNTALCDCESSCNEPLLKSIGSTTNYINFTESDNATNRFIFTALTPTMRDIRKVVNGNLDIIVSLGGTAGLFVGASILTIVEIFDYFLLNPLLTGVKKAKKRKSFKGKTTTIKINQNSWMKK